MSRLLLLFALLVAGPALAQSGGNQAPTSNPIVGILSVTSPSAASSLVVKAAPGNLYSVYATNLTATAGLLIVVNATAVPATGALSVPVLDCVVLPANASVSVNFAPTPPKIYTTGIVALISSSASCWTWTTGTVTAFISGSAP